MGIKGWLSSGYFARAQRWSKYGTSLTGLTLNVNRLPNSSHPLLLTTSQVSWSTLTPFRLVTCGEDGLARMWDVRKAALKQCGDYIDKSYYSWPEQEDDADIDMEMEQENCTQALLPNPLNPPSQGEHRAAADDSITINNVNEIGFGENHGVFVANNRIDEGVTLIAQMQHGALFEDNGLQGRMTHTVNKAVKVMCLARCPVGGHFATGSDDGVGHVWADDDDWHVERLDHELSDFDSEDGMAIQRRKAKLKSSSG